VPEIRQHSPELKLDDPIGGGNIDGFLKENGELRRMNASTILAFARQTSPSRLWDGPFVQLGNSKVEATFADHRTYIYKGKEIDHQVHLGFDLAVTAAFRSPSVWHAGCSNAAGWHLRHFVIIDHGMGVQSLYGHLSSFDVVGARSARAAYRRSG
jgi:murein DD-endopeptidase MepM/ murein hydrolase activator NlpD